MQQPTHDEIAEAYTRGKEDFGKHGVTHHAGSHVCPYRHGEHHPNLIKAWCDGFDSARLRSF